MILRRIEKQHEIRHVLGIAGALHDLGEVEHPLEDVVAAVGVVARAAGGAGGEDLAGADAVDADVVAAADARHVARQRIDAGLGGVVGRGRGAELVLHSGAEAALRGEGRHVDDRAAAGGDEVRPDGLADVERPGQVGVDDALPLGVRFVREVASGPATGIVEENVDRTVGVRRLGDGAGHRIGVADVAGNEGGLKAGIAQRRLDRASLLFAPRHQDHFRALLGEEMRGPFADAAVAAGDDRDLAR